MNGTATPTCRCGTPFDSRGACAHCDVVRKCPDDCALCRWRAHWCDMCHTRFPTITAAKAHADKDRQAEEARERKAR